MDRETGKVDIRNRSIETPCDIRNQDIGIGNGENNVETLNWSSANNYFALIGDDEDLTGIADVKFELDSSLLNESGNVTFTINESGIEKADVEKAVPISETSGVPIEIEEENRDLRGLTGTDSIDRRSSVAKADLDQVEDKKEEEDSESLQIIKEMSEIFNTKLSGKSLEMCYKLIDAGADHSALAELLKNWRLRKIPKPKRVLGHFFDPVPKTEKKEWVW